MPASRLPSGGSSPARPPGHGPTVQSIRAAALVRTIFAQLDADAARIQLRAVAEQLSAVAGPRKQRIRKLLDRTGHVRRDTPISSRYGGYPLLWSVLLSSSRTAAESRKYTP